VAMKKRKHKRKKRNAHIVAIAKAHFNPDNPFDMALISMSELLFPSIDNLMKDWNEAIMRFNKNQAAR
jgi:hypothetical protein